MDNKNNINFDLYIAILSHLIEFLQNEKDWNFENWKNLLIWRLKNTLKNNIK